MGSEGDAAGSAADAAGLNVLHHCSGLIAAQLCCTHVDLEIVSSLWQERVCGGDGDAAGAAAARLLLPQLRPAQPQDGCVAAVQTGGRVYGRIVCVWMICLYEGAAAGIATTAALPAPPPHIAAASAALGIKQCNQCSLPTCRRAAAFLSCY